MLSISAKGVPCQCPIFTQADIDGGGYGILTDRRTRTALSRFISHIRSQNSKSLENSHFFDPQPAITAVVLDKRFHPATWLSRHKNPITPDFGLAKNNSELFVIFLNKRLDKHSTLCYNYTVPKIIK